MPRHFTATSAALLFVPVIQLLKRQLPITQISKSPIPFATVLVFMYTYYCTRICGIILCFFIIYP
ncbi:hypothetical protein C2G38_898285 [Gigaspora rosea]|uniref:Uncharacterized protein n=1 Tax=Gigaspora rosea TaxID=44941 RepID=A0A397VMV5_9GLOM|nr:hypothetical protein C2G38_898285 [Gigaspora rosea]